MTHFCFSDEQREALAWAISEAARSAEKWLATEEGLEGEYGPD
jgi:hypothetical protein